MKYALRAVLMLASLNTIPAARAAESDEKFLARWYQNHPEQCQTAAERRAQQLQDERDEAEAMADPRNALMIRVKLGPIMSPLPPCATGR